MRIILIVVSIFSGFGVSLAQTNTSALLTNVPTATDTNSPRLTNENGSQTAKPTLWDKITVSNVITLLAVVVGASLGVGIDLIRKKCETRRIKRAIIQELEDCRAWLLRNKLTVEHLIQLSVIKQEFNNRPVPVPTHVYTDHFASVAIYFNKHERVSINSIHNLIRYADKQAEQLEQLIQESLSNGANEKRDEKIRVLLAGLHGNINLAVVHISNHLAYRENLNVMGLGGNLEAVDKDEAARIQQLAAEARNLGADGLKAKHYKT
jgi:hypothetical protein